jgi:hypothetical protein
MANKPWHPIRIVSMPFSLLRDLLRRLYIEHHAAMDGLAKGADFSARMEGFSNAKRTDAQFLLLAVAPSILESIVDYLVAGEHPWIDVLDAFATIWLALGALILLGSYASWFVKNAALYKRRK